MVAVKEFNLSYHDPNHIVSYKSILWWLGSFFWDGGVLEAFFQVAFGSYYYLSLIWALLWDGGVLDAFFQVSCGSQYYLSLVWALFWDEGVLDAFFQVSFGIAAIALLKPVLGLVLGWCFLEAFFQVSFPNGCC